MLGFFDASTTSSKKPPSTLPRCGACGLLNTCLSPKIPVTGEGKKGILIVGSAPGPDEDRKGRFFAGAAGDYLRKVLSSHGLNPERDCWFTNSIICKPKDGTLPSDDEIDYCRPNLMKTLRDLNPRMVIPLGFAAVKSLIAPYFRGEDSGTGAIADWAGWRIPLQKINTWICPSYDPSEVLENSEDRNGPVYKVWFNRHIEAALQLEGRPWQIVPDYRSEVELIFDPQKAAKWIRNAIKVNKPTSFDWETNCLKPDRDDAEIVSVGLCVAGKKTMSCPFTGEVVQAMREFLTCPCPKLGANTKFEERWSRKKLGVSVNNWVWCGMQSAHHLDNRKGITSVKFQAFVRLGFEPWDGPVAAYLQADDAVSLNRIREVDLRTLLLYNGIDAHCEYLIDTLQKEEMLKQNREYDGEG